MEGGDIEERRGKGGLRKEIREEKQEILYQTYRKRVFVDRTTASGYNIRRIERPEHGRSLTGVNDEQKFIVSAEKCLR